MGVSINMGTQKGWFIMDNPNLEWMSWGLPPILGNLHLNRGAAKKIISSAFSFRTKMESDSLPQRKLPNMIPMWNFSFQTLGSIGVSKTNPRPHAV